MKSKIVKNTILMQIAQGMLMCTQALYFIIIARCLNPAGYGAYASVLAFASFFSPFAGWGSGRLLIKHVARDQKNFSIYWGTAIVLSMVASAVFIALVCGLKFWLLPAGISWKLVLVIALADLWLANLTDLCAHAFQAVQQLGYTGLIKVLMSLLRATGACTFWLLPLESTALNWAYFYLGATAISAIISMVMVWVRLGPWRLNAAFIKELPEGFYFSVAGTSFVVSNDLDKVMLAKLIGPIPVGIYSAAYKLISVSYSPISSLLHSTYAQFFKEGEKGIGSAINFAKRLSKPAGSYSGLVAIAILVGAPIVPMILGEAYAESVSVLRWLAFLPLIKTFQTFGGDALTGAGFQRDRTALQLSTAIVNFFANLWFIPRYSWLGAVWTTLACDGLLTISVWLVLFARLKTSDTDTI